MSKFPEPIERLIAEMNQLPGVGPKTAERYAFSIIKRSKVERESMARAILATDLNIQTCSTCFQLSTDALCKICSDSSRDQTLICIVAEDRDLAAVEHTGIYRGLYHVLGGLLTPIDNILPQDLTIKELLERVVKTPPSEILMALDHTSAGETTLLYLARELKFTQIPITRLARGIPSGGELSYADDITLRDAIRGRLGVKSDARF